MITSADENQKMARQIIEAINNDYKKLALLQINNLPMAKSFYETIISNASGVNSIHYIDCRDTYLNISKNILQEDTRKIGKVNIIPILFHPWEKYGDTEIHLLTFSAIAISKDIGGLPEKVAIVYGREFKMKFVNIHKYIDKVNSDIQSLLNIKKDIVRATISHCSICEYNEPCINIAKETDSISLIGTITRSDLKKYMTKGISTITLLSYKYRYRRRRKSSRSRADNDCDAAKPAHITKNDNSLRAMAIKKNKLHIIDEPVLTIEGTPVFFDVESMPDTDTYYLIGLIYKTNNEAFERSYWANHKTDEEIIWNEFISHLRTIDKPILISYGAYEQQFIKKMASRYKLDESNATFISILLKTSINLLKVIYGKIYFPTFTNNLKDIAKYLGYSWSIEGASGVLSVLYRRSWELQQNEDTKQALITYNLDDCRATELILTTLDKICNSKVENDNTEIIKDDVSPFFTKYGKFVTENKDLSIINNAAYWSYQREKVYLRSTGENTIKKDKKKGKIRKYRINKIVTNSKILCCKMCGSRRVELNGRMHRDIVDIKFGNSYIKRWSVRYKTTYYKCKDCGRSSVSDERNQEKSNFGPGISAFIVYSIIDLHISQNMTSQILLKFFNIHIEQTTVNRLKSRMAKKYLEAYNNIKEKLISGKLIHADETHISVKGKDTYVWVFTSMEEVIYIWSETREGIIATEFLQDFKGVLVSDFYTAYSAIKCKQQRCLIHLIRDMNEDMRIEPFNQELKDITRYFGELVRNIIDTVDKHGLTHERIKSHKPDVSHYFDKLKSTVFETEIAIKLKKRLIGNMNELFTFLDFDNIPWNNNNAEHAIKAFAKIRNVISGTTNEVGIRDYMVLLSISQTCAYKNIDFVDFLISDKTII